MRHNFSRHQNRLLVFEAMEDRRLLATLAWQSFPNAGGWNPEQKTGTAEIEQVLVAVEFKEDIPGAINAGRPVIGNAHISLFGLQTNNSSLVSHGNGQELHVQFAATVTNARFSIFDVDSTDNRPEEFEVIRVTALLGEVPTSVQLSAGGQIPSFAISGNTATAIAGVAISGQDNQNGQLLVAVPGPLDSLTIRFENGGPGTNHGISFSDIAFDPRSLHEANPPVASHIGITTAEDMSAGVTLSAVDVENDPLTYIIVASPQHGTLSGIVPNLTYTPAFNYFGPDSFTYKVNDGNLDSNLAAVTLNVTAVNDAPVAADLVVTTSEDAPVGLMLVGSDVENDPLTYVIVGMPTYGTLSGTAPNLTYTPAANYFGPDSFSYHVSDGSFDSNLAVVTIDVTAVNDAPQASPVAATTAEDALVGVTLLGSDVENDPLSYTIVSQPQHGTLSGTAPNLTYTPAANYFGSDSFSYRVNDGSLDSNLAGVSITITGIPTGPTPGAEVINGVLKIIGTPNADLVGITRLFGQVVVAANFLPNGLRLFPASGIQRIEVRLREGNDLLLVAGDVGIPAILDGGDGNDTIYGGGGSSVILGGLGNDVIFGGAGRNVIIGGAGGDTLVGGGASDLLIAGTT